MKLVISYLTDDRRHFTFPHFVNLIKKSVIKNDWILLIQTHSNDSEFYLHELKNTDINYKVQYIDPNNNYLHKAAYAIHFAKENGIPFIMKCDNDVFLKPQTLDFMIENLHLLNNTKHLTIGPVLSSGIPGIEYFSEQFLDIDAKNELEKKFLGTTFYDRDGALYNHLNKHTNGVNIWDKDAFFGSVKSMDHHYKGVHPIRFNEDSLKYLNNYIIENKNRFLKDNDLSIIDNDNSPYLCNSIFCIKTEIYEKILYDSTLFVDAFEEVPLNKYCWNNNMNHIFVKNGFAIHMYYNWSSGHIQYENDFCNKFFG